MAADGKHEGHRRPLAVGGLMKRPRAPPLAPRAPTVAAATAPSTVVPPTFSPGSLHIKAGLPRRCCLGSNHFLDLERRSPHLAKRWGSLGIATATMPSTRVVVFMETVVVVPMAGWEEVAEEVVAAT